MNVTTTHTKVVATITLEENEIGFLRTILKKWSKGVAHDHLGFGGELLQKLKDIPTPGYDNRFPEWR